MTLTAVTKDGVLLNPSLSISCGTDETELIQKIQGFSLVSGLFCPHCLSRTGEYHQVKFRNAQVRAKHFYHPNNEEQKRECQHFSTESEKHMAAIAVIADTIATSNPTDLKIDVKWLDTDGVTRRKPDIWVMRGDKLEVHEVQISSISLDDFQQRSDDLRCHGASKVCWYLYKGNYNRSIRLWAKRYNVTVYRLWFDGSDIATPHWMLDDGVGLKDPKKASEPDSCEKKAKKTVGRNFRHQKTCNPTQKPKVVADITHVRKPGWKGVIHDRPWGMPMMLDIQWIETPEDVQVPRFPSRYPISELRQNEQEFSL